MMIVNEMVSILISCSSERENYWIESEREEDREGGTENITVSRERERERENYWF